MSNYLTVGQQYDTIYENAYRSDIEALWQDLSIVSSNTTEITNMCAYRLVTSYMNQSDTALRDRQKGLLSYLYSTDFDSSATSWIARISRSLPTGSNIPNLANKLNVLYDNKPQRFFSNNEPQEEYFQSLYKEMNINGFMQSVSEYTWLCDIIAVGVYKSGEDLIAYKLTPDNFRVTTDPQAPDTITSLMYVHVDNINQTWESHIWTNEKHVIITRDIAIVGGKVTTNEGADENPLGRIPFVFSTRGGRSSASLFSGGQLEMTYSQLSANLTALLSRNDEVYQSAPILLTKNFKGLTIDRRPGAFQNVDERDEEFPASAEFIRPDLVFDELTMQYNEKIKRQEISAGIPLSQTTIDRVVVESGIAKQIDNEPLNETRKKEIPYYEKFEKDLYQLIADHTDVYAGINTDEFTITYDEPQLLQEPALSYEFDKMLLRDGMIEISAFAKKYGSGFDITGNEDAMKMIEERKALSKTLEPIEEEEIIETGDELPDNL